MPDSTLPLDALVESLLGEPKYLGHPLREALAQLWAQNRARLERLERIVVISDGYQKMMLDSNASTTERYDRRFERLEKMIRISDGYQKMMRDLQVKLEYLSTRDQLTGLANRYLMLERLGEEANRAVRHQQPFAVALLDIDHFKAVNDRFGHDAGDKALVACAEALTAGLRDYDLCARWGGEEFLILLPDTDGETAGTVVDRLLQSLRGLPVTLHGQSLSITASAGLAAHRSGETVSETISRADAALLEAKRNGRDRAVVG